MKIERYIIFQQISDELDRAKKIHPVFPTDIIHQVSIMAEEAGEAVRAANCRFYGGAPLEDVKTELIHTAAMCLRCLLNIDKGDQCLE